MSEQAAWLERWPPMRPAILGTSQAKSATPWRKAYPSLR